ncbi:MAG: VOC family protein [Dehalococcoidia bacterium]|nr:VOC family protein [Dehalococcoidia bacterium]
MAVPPHWNVYIAVNDVDAVSRKVPAAGGRDVMPPMDVMDAGRMAMISDPTGAVVGLWEAKRHQGFQRVREHGAVTWAELLTDDPPPAIRFLSTVLGVPAEEMPMLGTGDGTYTLARPAQTQMAGVMKKTPDMAGVPNFCGVYFEVNDADAVVSRAKTLGGSVIAEPFDVPGIGRISWLTDPQGASFGVIKSAPPQNAVG